MRLVTSCMLAFVCASLSIAQTQEDPLRFSARLHGGFSATQVHGDQISGFNKFGLCAGASVDIRRSEWQGVQWGILYTQKGSRRVPDTKNGDFNSWRYRFTYIDMPLIRTWNPAPEWWWGAGIQPSVLVEAEEDFYGNGYSELSYLELNAVDFSGVLQVGYMWSDKAALEVRLSQSLLPISERPDQPVQRWDNFMMNMAIQWMVTWRLG
ncbi:MAG: porin family protein [Bacteroidota bacterium]|nr:porin family protein [Bacteroidota bacterium]